MRLRFPRFNVRTVVTLGVALGLLVIGFATGRLSAWIVPAIDSKVASFESKPPMPLDLAPIGSKASKAQEAVGSRALSPASDPLISSAAAASSNARLEWEPVIDVSSKADRLEPQTNADAAAVERCGRKFRSFDPADGTYKPFGQDTRVKCRYLAE